MTRAAGIVAALLVLAVASCTSGNNSGNGGGTSIAVNDGDHQTATVGTSTTVRPSVKVTDGSGSPFSGQTVTFAVASGGGSITGASAVTDASGIARVGSWTLGITAGTNTLTATLAGATGSPVTINATAIAGAAYSITKVGGDNQSAAVATAVTNAPSVKVVDQYGNPVAGATVVFTVVSGGGTTTLASRTTGADGVATLGSWSLGTTTGSNTLSASVSGATGVAPVTFTATATAGAAATIAKFAGDLQSAVAGLGLTVPPAVKLTDAYGNPINNAPVIFAVTGGGGSVSGASQSTSSTGVATVGGWTLGATPGTNTLTATSGQLVATFTATGTAALNAAQYAGTYNGKWINTTFATSGGGNVVIVVNQAAQTATATITVTGPVLGTAGIAQQVKSANYTPAGASFQGTVPVMGDVTATIDPTGHIVASGINVPQAGISRWDANGNITPTQLLLNFTVTFTSGPPAVGTITLTHQ